MRAARLAGLVAAGALAACNTTPPLLGPQLHGPVAAVAFMGRTHRYSDDLVRPYIAVASQRSAEVRLIDPRDHNPVPAPGFAFPLSIPTTDPFPDKLAAASFGDVGPDDKPIALPDVLVVASASTPRIQIISTWEHENRVYDNLDLEPTAGTGITVLAMIGVPQYAGPGTARIVVATSPPSGDTNYRLVAVDFARSGDADGKVAYAHTNPATAVPVTFRPVDLAFDPADPLHLYAATPDPVPDAAGVQGVAQITMSGDPTAWTFRGLSAGPPGTTGAPTRLVAAATYGERGAADPDVFGGAAARVIADLDTSFCGPSAPIGCGLVIIDPVAGGLAHDLGSPPTWQPYRAPIRLPADPQALAVGLPAAAGSQQCPTLESTGQCNPSVDASIDPPSPPQNLMRLAAGTGQTWTTAALAAPAADGATYVVDLGRSAVALDLSEMAGSTPTSVYAAVSILGNPNPAPGEGPLGIWTDITATGGAPAVVSADSLTMALNIQVTPGFTPSDSWAVVYQGGLRDLLDRPASVADDGTSRYAMLATSDVTGWIKHGDIADPALGVRVGDIVQFQPVPGICGGGQTTVSEILAPDDQHPGGALVLADFTPVDPSLPCVPAVRGTATAPTTATALINVVGNGYIVSGIGLGYVGRADLDQPFTWVWQDEDALLVDCPDEPPDDHLAWVTQRDQCEKLAVARKARRVHYPPYPSCGAACYPALPWIENPVTPGPALAFRVGILEGTSTPPGSGVTFFTRSGITPMSRLPASGSTPTAALAFDRSAGIPPIAPDEGRVFYVTYLGDALFEFSPSLSLADVVLMR